MIQLCKKGPDVLTQTVLNWLSRRLAAINAKIKVKENAQDQIYKIKSNSALLDQHPKMVVIMPSIYIVTKHVNAIVPTFNNT